MTSSKYGSDFGRPPGEPARETLDGLWSIYYRRGYEDGHHQAIRDVLGSLMVLTEEFLVTGGGTNDARQMVYALERHIELGIEEIARNGASGAGSAPPGKLSPSGEPPSNIAPS